MMRKGFSTTSPVRWSRAFSHALLLAVLILFSFAGCDSFKRRGIAPGDHAPELALNDINGEKFSLDSLKGKVVLVNFWATWCGPCVLELPALEKLQQRFAGKNFTVVGVAIDDDAESIKQFRAQYALSFPIVGDNSGVSRKRFHLTGVPETVLVDRDGKIVLFLDPEGGEPTVKVSGTREWNGESMVEQIEKLL